jgi:hypothetical protein
VSEQRQGHHERRSFSLSALKSNFAAMQFHAALNYEQTKSSSWNLTHVAAAVERLKQMLLVGLGNAATAISDPANRDLPIAMDLKTYRRTRRRILYGV